jgi:hypothetical protein
MRDGEFRLTGHQITVQQNIKVRGSRPPSESSLPAKTILDLLAHFQEVGRGPVRFYGGHSIDEIVLLMTPHRLGVIKRGYTHDPAGL